MESNSNILKRVYLFFFVLVAFSLLIIGAAINIQFFKGDEVVAAVKTTSVKNRIFPAKRGDLYAKDGSLLATSLTYYNVGLDLTSSAINEDTLNRHISDLADSLAFLIGKRTSKEYYRGITQAFKDKVRWYQLSSALNYPDFQRLKTLPFINQGRLKSGLAYSKFTQRKKPFGVLAARTIGSRAPFGLEGAYNSYLSGTNGTQLQKRKPGVWIPVNNDNTKDPIDGADVYSTIDINIQEVAENALKDQLFYNKADHGCAVVMEVATGKIRAIANLSIDTATGEFFESRNYAVADSEEPGSTIKLASFMAVLEKEQIDLDKKNISIGHGIYKIYDRKVRDSHYYPKNTILSVREIFEKSSNVGTVKLVEEYYKQNPGEFIERLYSFGLQDKLNVDIIGENAPKIKSPSDKDWYGTTLAWTCHGYETQFTPLQMLAYYNAVANDGQLVKPIFIEKIINANKEVTEFQPQIIKSSICSEATVKKLQELLKGVVTRGTAKKPFKGSLYEVAGKTGTAKINYAKNGKSKVEYRSSFAGYFPADNPRYTCIVVITNPRQNGFYGGGTAAPVFRKISDRVYALDKELRTELLAKNVKVNIDLKNGLENEYLVIAKELSIETDSRGGQEYANAKVKSNKLKIKQIKTNTDKVPNVKGLTVKDALYLLEQKGLTVKVVGKGKVRKQSLAPGSKIIEGKQIEIILG
ncbi:MAG: penicillin-binding transpeptidase domain-containing protein [Flavobacteriales bacterium]|nr:penicillin-binding transpeptidase domain-containing protein [Flavobacteriales bacterium]